MDYQELPVRGALVNTLIHGDYSVSVGILIQKRPDGYLFRNPGNLRVSLDQALDGGLGAAVIPRLTRDLHNEMPEIKGFSERNFKRMLAFYRAYPDLGVKVPPAVAQTAVRHPREEGRPSVAPISTPLLRSLPWAHHLVQIETEHWAARIVVNRHAQRLAAPRSNSQAPGRRWRRKWAAHRWILCSRGSAPWTVCEGKPRSRRTWFRKAERQGSEASRPWR